MRYLFPFCLLLIGLPACRDTPEVADNDVTTYVVPAAPTDKTETELDRLKRTAIVDEDKDLRVKRALKKVVNAMQAAAPAVPSLNDPRIEVEGCTMRFFNTRADGVATTYDIDLNTIDYTNGLRLLADDGVDQKFPAIGFGTKGKTNDIQVYENGVAMQRQREWIMELDTRERVQQAAGDLILALRICQDPTLGETED